MFGQGYHAVWIPVLAGIWGFGIRADLSSTFGRADMMMKYESNKLLAGCVRRYGARRAITISVAWEAGFILVLSVLLNTPIELDIMDFMFVAGVLGAYHFYCAYSNKRFKP